MHTAQMRQLLMSSYTCTRVSGERVLVPLLAVPRCACMCAAGHQQRQALLRENATIAADLEHPAAAVPRGLFASRTDRGLRARSAVLRCRRTCLEQHPVALRGDSCVTCVARALGRLPPAAVNSVPSLLLCARAPLPADVRYHVLGRSDGCRVVTVERGGPATSLDAARRRRSCRRRRRCRADEGCGV